MNETKLIINALLLLLELYTVYVVYYLYTIRRFRKVTDKINEEQHKRDIELIRQAIAKMQQHYGRRAKVQYRPKPPVMADSDTTIPQPPKDVNPKVVRISDKIKSALFLDSKNGKVYGIPKPPKPARRTPEQMEKERKDNNNKILRTLKLSERNKKNGISVKKAVEFSKVIDFRPRTKDRDDDGDGSA